MLKISKVIDAMIEYYTGDSRRIQHFMKVYSFAKTIGELENLSENLQEILEVTAVVHDIGLRISEAKYHSSAGEYQQLEGPPIAKELLDRLGYEETFIDRVCYLIAHHHTYINIEGIDYQILVEADFLVNISEDQMEGQAIRNVRQKIFKTRSGLAIIDRMYL